MPAGLMPYQNTDKRGTAPLNTRPHAEITRKPKDFIDYVIEYPYLTFKVHEGNLR
jgi:hypothetical protein